MQYTLQADGASAIVDTLGGEMISYKDAAGTEYLWNGDNAYWSGHAPVLFPVVGALKNGTVTIGGVPYNMPKHGFARKSAFILKEIHDSSATFMLVPDDAMLKMFPHDFTLMITHSISGKGFTTKYSIFYEGNSVMGCCIGGHAGLMCPLHAGEQFEDYEIIFDNNENCCPLYTDKDSIIHKEFRENLLQNGNTLPLRYADYDNDVLIFDAIESHAVTLKNVKTGSGLRFLFQGFNNLGVWTPPGKRAPFICLEPWKGLPAFDDETGAFENKPDTVWCGPKAMFSASYTMEVLE